MVLGIFRKSRHGKITIKKLVILLADYYDIRTQQHGTLNGKPTQSYTFKQNYYFMMGDNHWNSVDSRFWGFVPENHILGKAILVLFSVETDDTGEKKFRWKRLFNRIK